MSDQKKDQNKTSAANLALFIVVFIIITALIITFIIWNQYSKYRNPDKDFMERLILFFKETPPKKIYESNW